MNRILASQRRSGELAATIGDHFIHVHVELCATSRHPHMEWKHVLVLTSQDLVTNLHDELKPPLIEPISGTIRHGSPFLQRRVGGDHLARHQIFADAEVLQGTLRLSAPEFIDGNIDFAEAISLLPRASSLRIHARYPSNSNAS